MGTRVYVGRIPYRAGERDLERFFRGYGKIVEVILKNGYGFVEFADYRDADDAVHDLSGRELMGERISVELAKGTPRGRDRNGWQPPPRGGGRDDRRGGGDRRRDDRRFGGSSGTSRKRDTERTEFRLIVENLSSKVSWQDLKDAFRSVGEVTYADAHGKHRNEGLVEFATREDMKKAMEKMDGKELQGRKIKLTEEKASKRKSRSRSPKDRKKDHSSSRSRSRSGSRSGSGEPEDKPDKKNGKKKEEEEAEEGAGGSDNDNKEGGDAEAEVNRKRSRSPSPASGSQSPSNDAEKNGEDSPAPKRQRADSDDAAEGDADGVGDDDE